LQPAIVAKCRNRLLSIGCVTQDPNDPRHCSPRRALPWLPTCRSVSAAFPAPVPVCRFMRHQSTWSLRGVGRKAANPARDRSDFLVGDGLPLAVSSTILEGSRRDEISRLISGIFSHHSAEYLAHMIASPAASRQLVISTTEARLCTPFAVGAGV
jgi:hypothetical protein